MGFQRGSIRALCRASGLLVLAAISLLSSNVQAEQLIYVDTSGVDQRFVSAFEAGEEYWNSQLKDWNQEMPKYFRAELDPVQIQAMTLFIDGAGGVLGQAAPTFTKTTGGGSDHPFFGPAAKRWEVTQRGFMQFDIADADDLISQGFFDTVVRHEMAHVLGFGTNWAGNEALVDTDGDGVDDQYGGRGGEKALAAYRAESGNFGAEFVPLEQGGGGGTALAHWDSNDDFFNQILTTGKVEEMIGFLLVPDENGNNVPGQKFISETTLESMRDVGWARELSDGDGENDGNYHGFTKWYGGLPPGDWWDGPGGPMFQRFTAAPEPGSAALLMIGLVGFGLRRRRN